jgi:hypothetical protein
MRFPDEARGQARLQALLEWVCRKAVETIVFSDATLLHLHSTVSGGRRHNERAANAVYNGIARTETEG